MGVTRPDEPTTERLHAVVVLDDDVLKARKIANAGDLLRFEMESARRRPAGAQARARLRRVVRAAAAHHHRQAAALRDPAPAEGARGGQAGRGVARR